MFLLLFVAARNGCEQSCGFVPPPFAPVPSHDKKEDNARPTIWAACGGCEKRRCLRNFRLQPPHLTQTPANTSPHRPAATGGVSIIGATIATCGHRRTLVVTSRSPPKNLISIILPLPGSPFNSPKSKPQANHKQTISKPKRKPTW